MDKSQHTNDQSSGLLLTGTILMANINYTDLMDYAVKALIGGAIWMGFKIAGDFLSNKLKK